jgi:hypothetical protein
MKKIILVSLIFLFAGVNFTFAQEKIIPSKTYSIPSFNVLVDGTASFMEDGTGGNTKEKRDINVKVHTTSHKMSGDARVWFVKGNYEFILGPYTVAYNEVLTVPVDGDNWGVLVKSVEPAYFDVWVGSVLL